MEVKTVQELLGSIDSKLEVRRPDADPGRDDPRRTRRAGSRFVGEGATDPAVDELAVDLGAKGADLNVSEPWRPRPIPAQVEGAEGKLADTLHVMYCRRMGLAPARRAVKALAEGTPQPADS